jgi:hypothetical protein
MVVAAPYLQIPWNELRVDHVLPCSRFEEYVMFCTNRRFADDSILKMRRWSRCWEAGKADGLFSSYPADASDVPDAHYVVDYYGSCTGFCHGLSLIRVD